MSEPHAIFILGAFVSVVTTGWLVYRRYFTCDFRHRWKIVRAIRIVDYHGHSVGWQGDIECRRASCLEQQAIRITVPRIEDLTR